MVDAVPMTGNLAWAPLPAFEEVEVLDRFNGVPTLGVFGALGNRVLFWRVLGYVPRDGISAWLYVPLDEADEQHLADADSSSLMQGLVFQSSEPRAVTIGIAFDYRLSLEYPWRLPANLSSEDLPRELLRALAAELRASVRRALTPSRKRAARKASRAIREELAVV